MKELKSLFERIQNDLEATLHDYTKDGLITTPKESEDDGMSSEVNLTRMLRITDRKTKHLERVRRALLKMKKGEYGICEGCQDEISTTRLLARPEALLCMKCKEDEERAERQTKEGLNIFQFDRKVAVLS